MSENKHTPEPWRTAERSGFPFHIDDARGESVAMMLADDDHDEQRGLDNARRIVACVNACAGSSTEWLEFIVSEDCVDMLGEPRPFETRHAEVLREALRIMAERDAAEKQRDELLAVLEGLTGDIQSLIGESCGIAGLHMNGDIAPWSELEAGGRFERLTHLLDAHAAIASVKGGA